MKTLRVIPLYERFKQSQIEGLPEHYQPTPPAPPPQPNFVQQWKGQRLPWWSKKGPSFFQQLSPEDQPQAARDWQQYKQESAKRNPGSYGNRPATPPNKTQQIQQLEQQYHQTWNYFADNVLPRLSQNVQQARALQTLFNEVRPVWKSLRQQIAQNPAFADGINDTYIEQAAASLGHASQALQQLIQSDTLLDDHIGNFQSVLTKAFNAIKQLSFDNALTEVAEEAASEAPEAAPTPTPVPSPAQPAQTQPKRPLYDVMNSPQQNWWQKLVGRAAESQQPIRG